MTKQDYSTPPELIAAVEHRFGKLDWDLAARIDNSVCKNFISPEEDSLHTRWPTHHNHHAVNLWLNPPFADITPWAHKCAEWSPFHKLAHPGSRLFLLVPASVGSNWWQRHVCGFARVLALSPRLKFVGCADPYPKDCALCVYEPAWPLNSPLVEPWRWDMQVRKAA